MNHVIKNIIADITNIAPNVTKGSPVFSLPPKNTYIKPIIAQSIASLVFF